MVEQQAPATNLQRTVTITLLAVTGVLALLAAPLAINSFRSSMFAILNPEKVHEYTGQATDSIVAEASLTATIFPLPFVVFLTLAIVFAVRLRRQRYSARAARVERALGTAGDALSRVFAAQRTHPALSWLAFALSLGALYTLFGFDIVFSAKDDAVEQVALSLLIPVDPIMLAWAVPGIVLGAIARKLSDAITGLATTGMVLSIICLVLSVTKVGTVIPLVLHALVQAVSLATGS